MILAPKVHLSLNIFEIVLRKRSFSQSIVHNQKKKTLNFNNLNEKPQSCVNFSIAFISIFTENIFLRNQYPAAFVSLKRTLKETIVLDQYTCHYNKQNRGEKELLL